MLATLFYLSDEPCDTIIIIIIETIVIRITVEVISKLIRDLHSYTGCLKKSIQS